MSHCRINASCLLPCQSLTHVKRPLISGPVGQTSNLAPKTLKTGPKDHIDIRISHSGSKALISGYTRNTALQDPYVYVVILGPT